MVAAKGWEEGDECYLTGAEFRFAKQKCSGDGWCDGRTATRMNVLNAVELYT